MSQAGGAPVEGAVLVTVDSLRADALDAATAPTLSRFGSQGVAFERCFAAGNWTPFAFPSILGSAPVFEDSDGVGLAESPALAEQLATAGVETAGFNAANGFLTDHWGYDRGFDRFESFVDDGSGSKYLAAHPTVNGWVQLATSPVRRAVGTLRGNDRPFVDVSHLWDVERRAEAFLREVDGPFFLWIHYMDTHTPYVPAPRHLRAVGAPGMGLLERFKAHIHTGLGLGIDADTLEALRSLYRGAVHQVDASVGRLLETLEETGLRDSTAVVVTGDHGEEFQEHGHLAHYPKLYDELVRVPLLVDLPGAEPRRVSEPVSHDGLAPTLSAAMGAETDPFEADSLLPTLLEGESPGRAPVTSVAVRGNTVTQQPIPRRLDEGELLVSARDERYTYIHHTDSGATELYDRDADPGEQEDLAGEGVVPESVRERLHAAVECRGRRTGGDGEKRRETPEALDERLAALGYR
jgi:uncharacterized sulfatase